MRKVLCLIAISLIFPACLLAQNPSDQDEDGSRVVGIATVLTPRGFSISRFDVEPGVHPFFVLNRSGTANLEFVLTSQTGERLHQVRAERLRWKKRIQLPPGTYVLSVAGHDDWQCVIQVAPQQ